MPDFAASFEEGGAPLAFVWLRKAMDGNHHG
jgi:hypothetical protein